MACLVANENFQLEFKTSFLMLSPGMQMNSNLCIQKKKKVQAYINCWLFISGELRHWTFHSISEVDCSFTSSSNGFHQLFHYQHKSC